jgi:hypothetical protein
MLARWAPTAALLHQAVIGPRSFETARHARRSSIAAVPSDFSDTLASMTKHSCRALADLGLTQDPGN